MEAIGAKQSHWDQVYTTKALEQSSWYQPRPSISLGFMQQLSVAKDAAIIDVGGGDSLLVDHLLDLDYQNISVLDISPKALEKAQTRLGTRAKAVKWILADAAEFDPTEQYDFWHDRAAFHFLTTEPDIQHYVQTAAQAIKPGGFLVMGTFSEQGPKKCSGLEIKQYSEQSLTETFAAQFKKRECYTIDHLTPSKSVQNFIFCVFQRNRA
ncbi:class I SAM-dependent methyltransferase [Haliscomenobacter hydrossis]|uniref:Methyltransferase type 12 n=1 Tax=Haliscomenobacter hydrossis (strain ATCC 27775 / DSM 1100 / LMG 10767 / O) TaxID=760192 RepID=F4L2W1_HALH1|nr:class I SAM-dependent methyltransferase [Haliscomenobacter hydrossis]AEE49641.1 Methyltransferase type 12 [Haliscomenobacter hydrossis DSM 1100]